jgi:hypothetical protein
MAASATSPVSRSSTETASACSAIASAADFASNSLPTFSAATALARFRSMPSATRATCIARRSLAMCQTSGSSATSSAGAAAKATRRRSRRARLPVGRQTFFWRPAGAGAVIFPGTIDLGAL